MKAATITEIKKEVKARDTEELVDLCLHLAKFKKENKEFLTYLLFEASDEAAYIEGIKRDMDDEFELINRRNFYYIKKSVRKILRALKKHIRFSKRKETEVELLIHFCIELRKMSPAITGSIALHNLYIRQIEIIKKAISSLHEDLQFDYLMELEGLQ